MARPAQPVDGVRRGFPRKLERAASAASAAGAAATASRGGVIRPAGCG